MTKTREEFPGALPSWAAFLETLGGETPTRCGHIGSRLQNQGKGHMSAVLGFTDA